MRRRQRPIRIGDCVRDVVAHVDPDRRLEAYRVWTFWDDEVGASVAARAQPARFHAGVLAVRVSSAAWMQELQFLKEQIRVRLNARLGAELIRDIRFESGSSRADAGVATSPYPRRPTTGAPAALPLIRDPRLASVFERIARAHARRATESNEQ